MAEAQQRDKALGAGLIADDRWLVTKLLRAETWGQGSAEEAIDGRAWRRFGERIAALADRISGPLAPPAPVDRADAQRYLAMLIRNAFDFGIEEHDPDRPHIAWLTRRNKIGWDCPDAFYALGAIRGTNRYRLRGRRGSVHFLGIQVMSGIRSLANAHDREWQIGSDGRFEIALSAERPPGAANWIPLAPEADCLAIRQFFYDWENEEPAVLAIDRVGGPPPRTPNGHPGAEFWARRLDAIAGHVEANVDLWLETAVAQRERFVNRFPEQAFGGEEMGAQKHQQAGTGHFRITPDEALLVEVKPPRALYWSFDLCNFWLESLDYANHQSSLNGHQARLDGDGWFRGVVALADPGVPNWLDPAGHCEGSMIYRWNLADAMPIPQTRVVKLSELRAVLPPDTPRVSAEERARTIESRRQGVRRRFSRPL
jgi:hypothetical protein